MGLGLYCDRRAVVLGHRAAAGRPERRVAGRLVRVLPAHSLERDHPGLFQVPPPGWRGSVPGPRLPLDAGLVPGYARGTAVCNMLLYFSLRPVVLMLYGC